MEITFDSIIGKHILIGLTCLDGNGEVAFKTQLHGEIVRADKDDVITVKRADTGDCFTIPPNLTSIEIAEEGVYTLDSTGEEVTNPDLLSRWTINYSGEASDYECGGYTPV